MPIPDHDHVVRHISNTKLDRDEEGNIFDENGKPFGVTPQAFLLRDEDKGSLSVNWLQYYKKGGVEENFSELIQDVRKSRNISQAAQCGFAAGNVGEIKVVCNSVPPKKVKVVHSKTPTNQSHSSIIRLPFNHEEIMRSLARIFSKMMVMNKDVP